MAQPFVWVLDMYFSYFSVLFALLAKYCPGDDSTFVFGRKQIQSSRRFSDCRLWAKRNLCARSYRPTCWRRKFSWASLPRSIPRALRRCNVLTISCSPRNNWPVEVLLTIWCSTKRWIGCRGCGAVITIPCITKIYYRVRHLAPSPWNLMLNRNKILNQPDVIAIPKTNCIMNRSII